jgi:hypothetical protein
LNVLGSGAPRHVSQRRQPTLAPDVFRSALRTSTVAWYLYADVPSTATVRTAMAPITSVKVNPADGLDRFVLFINILPILNTSNYEKPTFRLNKITVNKKIDRSKIRIIKGIKLEKCSCFTPIR